MFTWINYYYQTSKNIFSLTKIAHNYIEQQVFSDYQQIYVIKGEAQEGFPTNAIATKLSILDVS